MAKPAHPHPDKLALYEKLAATNSGVERKGATVPCTSYFLKKYNAKLCGDCGLVQKEYVEVPDTLLAKTAELKKL